MSPLKMKTNTTSDSKNMRLTYLVVLLLPYRTCNGCTSVTTFFIARHITEKKYFTVKSNKRWIFLGVEGPKGWGQALSHHPLSVFNINCI